MPARCSWTPRGRRTSAGGDGSRRVDEPDLRLAPRLRISRASSRSACAACGSGSRRSTRSARGWAARSGAFPRVLVAGTNGKGSTAATLASIARGGGPAHGALHLAPPDRRSPSASASGGRTSPTETLDAALARSSRRPPLAGRAPDLLRGADRRRFRSSSRASRSTSRSSRSASAAASTRPTWRPRGLSLVTSIGSTTWRISAPRSTRSRARRPASFGADRPALVWADADEARAALRRGGAAAGSGCTRWTERSASAPSGRASTAPASAWRRRSRRYALATPLAGAHQARNAALAVRAAEILAEREPRLGAASIADGVAAVRWPGRLERFRAAREDGAAGRLPQRGGRGGAGALPGGARICAAHLIFGVMADKEIEEIGANPPPALRPRLLHRARVRPRLLAGGAAAAARRPRPRSVHRTVGRARAGGSSSPARRTEPIIVAGSLYLVGEARAPAPRRPLSKKRLMTTVAAVFTREDFERAEEERLAIFASKSARAQRPRGPVSRAARATPAPTTPATGTGSSTPAPSGGSSTRRRSSSPTRATTSARV